MVVPLLEIVVSKFGVVQDFVQKAGPKNFPAMHRNDSRPPISALEEMMAPFDSYHFKSELDQYSDQCFS